MQGQLYHFSVEGIHNEERKLGQDFEELIERAKQNPEIKAALDQPYYKSREEILALADKWEIEYELDSDNPGIFMEDEEGMDRKVSIEDLLFL